ncbi:MAG: HisA/HisF-related TIM barrel protein [Promethearchaeota archaeon]|jgi:phosphoribosylformimino-5-aminoimidazole carboxamide ribotide isomerase
MKKFKVLPVIDILNNQAVHAKRGERTNYKPLKSKLFNSSDPLDITRLLTKNYGFEEIYIADLDAIINDNPNFHLFEEILKIPRIKIMVDLGITKMDDILRYSELGFNKIIIGIETLQSLEDLKEGLKLVGNEKIVISLDMYQGKILSNAEKLKNYDPLELVNKLELLGVKEIILLDLARVGQKVGGIPQSYFKIQNAFKGKVFVGGGIKNFEDLIYYEQHHFSGVLVATALYDGTIEIEKIRKFQ